MQSQQEMNQEINQVNQPMVQEKRDELVRGQETINTPYGEFNFRNGLRIACGSYMQLLVGILHHLNQKKTEKNNEWMEYSLHKIADLLQNLHDKSVSDIDVLLKNPDYNSQIVLSNFAGFTNLKLPRPIRVLNVNPNATYETVNVLPLLRTISQRLNHLVRMKQVPQKYMKDEKNKLTFEKIQELANTLLTEVRNIIPRWKEICNEANKHTGVEKVVRVKSEEKQQRPRQNNPERRQNNVAPRFPRRQFRQQRFNNANGQPPQFIPPQFQQQFQPQQFQPQPFQPQQFQPQPFQPRQFQPQVQQFNNPEQQFRPRQFKVPDGQYQQRPQFPRTNGWVPRMDNRAPINPNMEQTNLPYRARFNMQRNNRREQPESASVENN
jgi:hypothetical protein